MSTTLPTSVVFGWLEAKGVSLARVAMRAYGEAGTGLAAAGAIAAGEVALSVPPACWRPLSAEGARAVLPTATVAHVERGVAEMGGGASLADSTLLAAALVAARAGRAGGASAAAPLLRSLPARPAALPRAPTRPGAARSPRRSRRQRARSTRPSRRRCT